MRCRPTPVLMLIVSVVVLAGLLIGCRPNQPQPIGQQAVRSQWTVSRVRGTPEPPPEFTVEESFGGISFYAPTFMAQVPATDRFVVGELCGRIYQISKHAPDARPHLLIDLFADLPDRPPEPGPGLPIVKTDNPLPAEQLFDLAFHPNFAANRFLFVTYAQPGTVSEIRVSRFELDAGETPQIRRETEIIMLTWESSGHSGGCVRFGPDGYLYVTTGDGVGPNPPDSKDAGQDISSLQASVLRIDVDKSTGDLPYAIPVDNPFVDTPGARPEVWAYGLRNPWKMGFDHETGELWLGDVGWESWEMVHRIVRGGNYGWPIMEGRMPLRTEVTPGPTPIIPPVKDYSRSEANSITGGVVYSGKKYDELSGYFVYGDYRTGKIWALAADEADRFEHRELTRTTIRIIAFTQDTAGEIFVLDHDLDGKIYRLIRSPQIEYKADFPTKLSETGLFASVKDLKPSAGVVPYQVTVEPWIDGASAERFVALPGSSKIKIDAEAAQPKWSFPDGAVLVRNLIDGQGANGAQQRIETQLLHYENRQWRAYTYAWNDAQDDAELVAPAGSELKLSHQHDSSQDVGSKRPHVWKIVSRAECIFCHRPSVGTVLGFEPAQLNRDVDHGDGEKNQLQWLSDRGIFDGDPTESVDSAAALTNPYQETADLDDRARSYLAVNCGICHNPYGESITMFYLRRHYSLEETKAFKKAAIGTFGIHEPQLVTPGEPYRSALLYRMGKLGYARMPYVGSQVVDSRGFSLIHDWIASLEQPTPTGSQSVVAEVDQLAANAGSVAAQAENVRKLLASTSGAMALAAFVHRGVDDGSLVQEIVASSQQSPSKDIRGLFEAFISPALRQKRLGPSIQPESILSIAGDVARGKLIYLSDSSRCQTCHSPDAQGQTLGADLKQIGKKYGKTELLQHILEPSVKIDPEFTPYLLVTTSGKPHIGVIVEKNDDVVVLKDAGKQIVSVPSAEVESLEKQTRSLMPERLLSDMTAQEAADLLEYLSSLKEPTTTQ